MAATAGMTVAQVLRGELDAAHQLLEATMADVDDALAARPAPGQANRIGSTYAHAVLAEDGVVNGLLRGQAPLFAGEWAERTGTDRPVVISGAAWPGVAAGDMGEWHRTLRVELGACRAYAQAVYADTVAFLEVANDATLARPIDLSFIGMGTMPVALVVPIFVTGHIHNMCGEISALKGAFGHKGYPF